MDISMFELARPILDAVMRGQWAFAAAAALVLLVTAARRYGSKRFPFLASDLGGVVLTLLGSFGGALATAFAAGSAPSWALAFMAVKVATAAAGGYAMLKKSLVPALTWLRPKMPAWMHPMVDMVLWVFSRPTAVEKATQAGEAAVKKTPAAGVEGITGKPRDFR